MRDDWKIKAKEWSDKSKYNSFNSFKGLTYYDSHYKPIADWWNNKEGAKLPPPIELSLDPGHLCNFQCEHCYFTSSAFVTEKRRTIQQTKEIIRKFYEAGTMEWRFTGG